MCSGGTDPGGAGGPVVRGVRQAEEPERVGLLPGAGGRGGGV